MELASLDMPLPVELSDGLWTIWFLMRSSVRRLSATVARDARTSPLDDELPSLKPDNMTIIN